MSATLFELSAEMAAIEDALIESGGELTPELETALVETEQGLSKKIDGYCAIISKLSYTEDILAAEIKRLQNKKKVAGNAKERLKTHVCDTMGTFGITKLESNFNTMTRRKSAKVEVNEDQAMAAFRGKLLEFIETMPPFFSVDVKVNKAALKEYIKETGITPAGVEFIENYTLQIR